MKNQIFYGAVAAVVIVAGVVYWSYLNQVKGESLTNQMSGLNSGENAEPGSIHNLPAEPAAVQARKDLATKLQIDEASIVIMLVENKTWSDGCLGLGGPAESCLAALTEGFRVELVAKGKTYVYRTDATGAAVRAESQM